MEIGKKGGRKARETTVMVGVKEPPLVSPSFVVLPRWCSRSEIRGAGDGEEPHHFLSHSRFHTPTSYINSMGFFNSANLFIGYSNPKDLVVLDFLGYNPVIHSKRSLKGVFFFGGLQKEPLEVLWKTEASRAETPAMHV